jgi:hypothetical protein
MPCKFDGAGLNGTTSEFDGYESGVEWPEISRVAHCCDLLGVGEFDHDRHSHHRSEQVLHYRTDIRYGIETVRRIGDDLLAFGFR